MKIFPDPRRYLVVVIATASLAMSCSDADVKYELTASAVQNGTPDPANTFNAAQYNAPSGGCSASLVTNNWVLTAQHCVRSTPPNSIQPGMAITYDGGLPQALNVVAPHPSNASFVPGGNPENIGIDIILLRVAAPFQVNGSTAGFFRPDWPQNSSSLAGTSPTVAGWGGAPALATGVFNLGSISVEPVTPFPAFTQHVANYTTPNGANPAQSLVQGDSGGGGFLTQFGFTYRVSVEATTTRHVATSTPTVRDWMDQTLFTPFTQNAGAAVGRNGPAVSRRAVNSLDVFWINDTTGNVNTLNYDSGWGSTVVDIGRPGFFVPLYRPAAVSRTPNLIEVFVVDSSGNKIYYKQKVNGTWQPSWQQLNGIYTAHSAPAVASWGAGRLDVFVKGASNQLLHEWFDNSTWAQGWESFPGDPLQLAGAPAAVSWGPGRLDIFVRALDNTIRHKAYDGNWYNWENNGGNMAGDPAVTSWAPGRLDIFARGTNGRLQHLWWQGAWVEGWINGNTISGTISNCDMTGVSWGPGRIDLLSGCFGTNFFQSVFPS
jgi:hypothetical protein